MGLLGTVRPLGIPDLELAGTPFHSELSQMRLQSFTALALGHVPVRPHPRGTAEGWRRSGSVRLWARCPLCALVVTLIEIVRAALRR